MHNWVGNEHASAFVNFKVHNPAKPPPLQPKILNRDPLNNVQVIRAQVLPGSHTLALFVDVMLFPPQDYALVATFPPGAITISEI